MAGITPEQDLRDAAPEERSHPDANSGAVRASHVVEFRGDGERRESVSRAARRGHGTASSMYLNRISSKSDSGMPRGPERRNSLRQLGGTSAPAVSRRWASGSSASRAPTNESRSARSGAVR